MHGKRGVWWAAAVCIVAAGIIAGLTVKPKKDGGFGTSSFRAGGTGKNKNGGGDGNGVGLGVRSATTGPLLLGFKGDLAKGCMEESEEGVTPFVVGSILGLDVEWRNATRFRWTCNGKVVPDKDGEEWGPRAERWFEVKKPGEMTFTVQARGENPRKLSGILKRTIKTESLHITSFSPSIYDEGEDRVLTGDDYTVEVETAEPDDDVEYLYRYFINNRPIKHPEDGKEWTTEDSLTYAFPVPGKYTFKVEVRRKGAKVPEATATLSPIVVADAIIENFDATPENTAPAGSEVLLDTFIMSLNGDVECRFGVMPLQEGTKYEWILTENGNEWGGESRMWRPTVPGNYRIRVELRDNNGDGPDDVREIPSFIVTAGEIEF